MVLFSPPPLKHAATPVARTETTHTIEHNTHAPEDMAISAQGSVEGTKGGGTQANCSKAISSGSRPTRRKAAWVMREGGRDWACSGEREGGSHGQRKGRLTTAVLSLISS